MKFSQDLDGVARANDEGLAAGRERIAKFGKALLDERPLPT